MKKKAPLAKDDRRHRAARTVGIQLAAALLVCALAIACRGENSSTGTPQPTEPAHARKLKVGVTQIATHPGIDAVRNGFVDELATEGFRADQEVAFEYTNANGDFSIAQAIAKKFASNSYDLIFSVSTPSTQALVAATKGTSLPIVFGAVTDPISAGIVSSLEHPGGNITGTTDVWPIDEQFGLLQRLVPTARRIGILHNPAEANSQFSVKTVREVIRQRNLDLVEVPVSNSNEVPAAARSLVGRVDAIYIPADNTVISAIAAVVAVSEENHIPLMPGDTSNVEVGGFGTIGHDYASVGAESARIAVRIFRGTPAGEIPVSTSSVRQYYFNLRSAKATGVTIPEELLRKAAKVYE
jgi:putative ABC transport system substrate-binding protein